MALLLQTDTNFNYKGILNLHTLNGGLTASLQAVEDGTGLASPLSLSTTNADIKSGSVLSYGGANALFGIAPGGGGTWFFGEAGNLTATGINNVGTGLAALSAVSSGIGNTAYGRSALRFTTTASNNNAFGGGALRNNITGESNLAFGTSSKMSNTDGDFNVTIGGNIMMSDLHSSNNTVVGYQSLLNYSLAAKDGSGNNTVIGYNTGLGIVTGINNTIIGASVSGLAAALSNNIIFSDGSGNVRMQSNSSGRWGITGVTNAASMFQLPAGTATANTAPLQFTIGVPETTGRAGIMEYSTINAVPQLTLVRSGTTRETILMGNIVSGTFLTINSTKAIQIVASDGTTYNVALVS